jgi:hypothetical protein
MSDFTFIGKNVVCEPYLFRGEITSNNKLTVVSSSNFLGTITASIISASRFIGYIDSASYAITSSYTVTSSYALTSSYTVTSSYALTSSFASTAISSAFALSSSYALTSSYANTSSYTVTSSYAITSSYADTALSSAFAYSSSYSLNSISSSYALTASYALNAGAGGSGGGIFVATSSIIEINFSSSVDNFVTNGVNYIYTLSFTTYDPTQLLVFLDGLEQEPVTDYNVSGTTLTLASVPPALLELEVRRFFSSANINIITASLNAQYFTGDGTTTQYALTQSVLKDHDILVTLNGLLKKPTADYTTTGSILNFISAPISGSDGQIRYMLSSTTGLLNLNPIEQDLIPGIDSTYNLGSPTKKWKDLYISTGSIYIGQTVLTTSGSTLFSNANPVVTLNTSSGEIQVTGISSGLTSSYALNATTSSYALTASYALNGGSGGTTLVTGSLYPITSSWALTASFSLNAVSQNITNAVSGSFYSSSVWEFTHSLSSQPILIQTYDLNFNQIIPQNISLINSNVTRVNFPVSESGYVIASRSGLQVISSSVTINNDLITGSTYPITSSWSLNSNTSSYINPLNQIVILTQVSSSLQFTDDIAAAAGGVPLGGLYRNGNFILIRLT